MTDGSNDERAAATFDALYAPGLFSKRTHLWGQPQILAFAQQ